MVLRYIYGVVMNNSGLGKFSSKLFTLNTFYSANKIVVGGKIEDKTESFLTRYWEMVVVNMLPC